MGKVGYLAPFSRYFLAKLDAKRLIRVFLKVVIEFVVFLKFSNVSKESFVMDSWSLNPISEEGYKAIHIKIPIIFSVFQLFSKLFINKVCLGVPLYQGVGLPK